MRAEGKPSYSVLRAYYKKSGFGFGVNSRSLPSQRGHNPQLNLMRRKKDSTMQILPFVCVISKGRFA